MREITTKAMETIMSRAPVWAASMAGRTKVFTDPDVPTAYVTGGDGRFKIVVNDKIADSPDLEFVLLHEIAHIFREDGASMQRHKHLTEKINIAADCIINDSLVDLGLPRPSFEKDICWGRTVFKRNCVGVSINSLMNVTIDESDASKKSTAPGNVDSNGNELSPSSQGGGTTEERGTERNRGSGEDLSHVSGLGKDPIIHTETLTVAKSVAAYAKKMFFPPGFKSKNVGTKTDWRKNRSAFSGRTDIVIPRTTIGEYGNERSGPLINLVLDTSGSMNQSWVATASVMAGEIRKAGLDFDLWISPGRLKAKCPEKALDALQTGEGLTGLVETASFPGKSHSYGEACFTPEKGRPSGVERHPDGQNEGADELDALSMMETGDPVLWVYIGDYWSRMNRKMHFKPNFLHVLMSDGRHEANHPKDPIHMNYEAMKKHHLPHWVYKV